MKEPSIIEGRVVRVDARQIEVLIGEETRTVAFLGRVFDNKGEDKCPVAVGDCIKLRAQGGNLGVESVLERTNVFARRASGEDMRRQLLAANVDRVVVVASFGTPPFSSITVDRILVSSSFAGIAAAIVLNKTDLSNESEYSKISTTYKQAGYTVIATSATEGTGIEELTHLLAKGESVLYGLSGVGKSSLLNCIQPGLGLKTREVSGALNSGRHATAFARRWPLEAGGAVIDTPGVRVFRPWGIPPAELRLHFPEMAELGRECKYPACLHRGEPECAIEKARKKRAFPESRYRSYAEILAELETLYGGTAPVEI
ncbi:MAG TPA: ribosome small subunit-dependent GTPase A [Planctomycetes bacterium]|nr:ribosome small subunit-dependent GTPase A [Planctomycetota bacterium]